MQTVSWNESDISIELIQMTIFDAFGFLFSTLHDAEAFLSGCSPGIISSLFNIR